MATEKVCSFCKIPVSRLGIDQKLIEGDGVSICTRCVEACLSSIKEQKVSTKAAKGKKESVPKPTAIKKYLDEFIIGQDYAKTILSVAVCDHYKRIDQPVSDAKDAVVIEKSNVLVIGPTGTGKTHIAQSIAKRLGVPFAIGDATSITEAGYVGEDVEGLLWNLLQAADGDVEEAQRGILFLDEVDKLRKTGGSVSTTRDVGGEGVQQALLKIIEGKIASVPSQGGRKNPSEKMIQFDTTNVLFICSGAFVGLDEIIKERLGVKHQGTVGFGLTSMTENLEDEKTSYLMKVEPEDLIRFGLIPEFVGRLPITATLEALDKVSLRRIFLEPKNSLYKQYCAQFALDGIKLEITDKAIDEIVDEAFLLGTGARGLRAITERMILPYKFDIEKYIETKVCKIDGSLVKGDFHLTTKKKKILGS